MYYSKNSELKITLLLVNIIVNKKCQHSQNYAAGANFINKLRFTKKRRIFNFA